MSCDVHGEVRVASRSKESVSVESQGLCFMRINCVPIRQPHAYDLHRKYTKCPTIYNFIVRYFIHNYMARTELLNDIDDAQLLYHGTV